MVMCYMTPVPFLVGVWNFVTTFIPYLEYTQTPCHRYWWIFPGAKMVKRDVVHARPNFTEV
jgi:hypothetical protein